MTIIILHTCTPLTALFTTMDDMMLHGYTVVDAMVTCGVDHDVLFLDETQAQRLASDIFGDQFSSCLDITVKELESVLVRS